MLCDPREFIAIESAVEYLQQRLPEWQIKVNRRLRSTTSVIRAKVKRIELRNMDYPAEFIERLAVRVKEIEAGND